VISDGWAEDEFTKPNAPESNRIKHSCTVHTTSSQALQKKEVYHHVPYKNLNLINPQTPASQHSIRVRTKDRNCIKMATKKESVSKNKMTLQVK
jgi:hypothetical protein